MPSLNRAYMPKCHHTWKKSINQAHLEDGTYEQIVTHLERKLELNALEAADKLQINTVSQQPSITNAGRPKPTFHYCKNQDSTEISVVCWKNRKTARTNWKESKNPGKRTVTPITLTRTATSTKITTTTTTTETVTEPKESLKLFTHPVRHVEKQTTPQRIATLEPMQPINRLPGTKDRKDKTRSQKEPIEATLMKIFKLQLKI